jgi:hypothetical protein
MTAMFCTRQLAAMTRPNPNCVTFVKTGESMLINARDARIQLLHGDHLRLRLASGARLTCVEGTAWITIDRDARDVLVPAGGSFVVPSDRPVLVGPLFGAATLDLHGTPRTVAEAVSGPAQPRSGPWRAAPAWAFPSNSSLSY